MFRCRSLRSVGCLITIHSHPEVIVNNKLDSINAITAFASRLKGAAGLASVSVLSSNKRKMVRNYY